MDWIALASIVAFVLILIILVALRIRSGNRFEAKNTDIVLALVPIALLLLVTGKIKTFQFGDVRVESAIVKAAESPIKAQVTQVKGLPVTPVTTVSKRGVEIIPQLIAGKTEALEFRLGHGGYFGPAIRQYFTELSKYPFWRYVVIDNADGSFFGMINGRSLMADLDAVGNSVDRFAEWLNEGNQPALAGLYGFIPKSESLDEGGDKGEALAKMEDLATDFLPVVNKEGRFMGVVDRSRLTASLIIDVTQELKAKS